MKKKNIVKVKRSKIAAAFYYIQFAVVSPVLIPLAVVQLTAEGILNAWVAYKNWYLKKTLHN